MTTLAHLLAVEMRRALRRRVTRVLVLLALALSAVLGVIAFFDSAGRTVAEMRVDGTHPAVMADWWVAGTGDGILMICAIPLLVGGLIGGATFAGAEWKAGSVTTLLTWEPRRLRVQAARTTAAFLLAVAVAAALEVAFLLGLAPAVLAHGSAAGVDGAWLASLLGAGARIALLTGVTAALGVSLATVGRGSTFALAAVFAWMAFGENLVRGFKPSLQHLLVGENLSVVLTWAPLEGARVAGSGVVALATVGAYLAVAVAAAASSFARRDIAGAG